MIPSINIKEVQAGLAVLPAGARTVAICGPASGGPISTPQAFGMINGLRSVFKSGPLVEAAALHLARGIIPICCRTEATALGSASIVTTGMTGTSVATLAASPAPIDDLDVRVRFPKGGTIGTAGITYQVALDGGQSEESYGPVTALGIANSIALPTATVGAVSISLAAGTVADGTYVDVRTVAPAPATQAVTDSLDALGRNRQRWNQILLATPMTTALMAAADTAMASLITKGRRAWWLGNARMPTPGEDMLTYLAAMGTLFGSSVSKYGALGFADSWQASAISSLEQLRPISYGASVRFASVDEHIDIAQRGLGSLGTRITDKFGNAARYDEIAWPGADDNRFMSCRTWYDKVGTFINNPRLFSQTGDSFEFVQHRRVANLAQSVCDVFFADALSKELLVSRKTGYILESEASRLEDDGRAAVWSVIGQAPMASDFRITLSRTDALLSSKTMTGTVRLTPLAYPKTIELEFSLFNPALQTREV